MIRWWKDYNFTMHMMFLLLLLITGTHGVYTVTLKASSKAFASTSNDIIINVRGPHSSTPDSTIDGVPNNQEKSVNIYKDVGLPSCVTARNTGSNGLLISWIKISSYSYDDVTLIVDEWIEKGKQEKITKCRSNCPAAYGKKGEVCRKCGDNTYSDGDSTYCKNCPGTQKSGVGATTCRPVTCNGGYRVGGHACNICPKNTYSKGGTSATCTDCKDNEISDEGASACNLLSCKDGEKADEHRCSTCPENTFAVQGDTNCTKCGDNQNSTAGSGRCTGLSCKDGEKADEHRCSTCPENTFAVQGDIKCTKCGDNQTSAAGSGRCTGLCTSLPGEWNVTTELNTTLKEGDTISLRCGENYTNIGSDVITCVRGETYNFSKTPKCAQNCTELPDLEHMDRNRTNEKVPTLYNSTIPLSCRSGYMSAGALHCGPNGTFSLKQNTTCTKISTDVIAESKIKKAHVVYGTSSAGGIILCIVFILFLTIIIRKHRRHKKEDPPSSQYSMEMSVVVNDCNSDVYDTLERSPEQRKARAGRCPYSSINVSATPRNVQAPDDDTYNVPFPENKEEEEEDYDVDNLYTTVDKIKNKAHPEFTADDDQYSMPFHKNRSRGSHNDDVYNIPDYNDDVYNIPENDDDVYNIPEHDDDIYNIPDYNDDVYNIRDYDDDVYNIPDYNDDVYNIPDNNDDVYNIPDAQTNNHSFHYDDGELYNTLNRNGLSRLPQIDDETYNVLLKDRKPSSPTLCFNDEMYSTLSK